MAENTATKQATSPTNHKVFRHLRAAQSLPATESEFEPGQLEPRKLYRRRRYIRARINVLGRQYIKLRNDLLAAERPGWKKVCWQRDYALRGKEYLVVARQELLSPRPRIYLCSSLLYFAEGNLAWLYRPGILMRRCQTAMNRLEKLKRQGDDDAAWLLDNLQGTRDMLLGNPPGTPQMDLEHSRWLRSALADTIEYFSQQDHQILMNDDLQVARLRSLLWYVGAALSLLVLAAPYVTISLGKGIPGWPVVRFGEDWLTQAIAALWSAVGAVGGIFSGLVSTRDSGTTLDEYRASSAQTRFETTSWGRGVNDPIPAPKLAGSHRREGYQRRNLLAGRISSGILRALLSQAIARIT